MPSEPGSRKLATIMAVDLAGYSAMAERDETAAIDAVARVRDLLESVTQREGGRIFNTAGDGFMLEFASAAGALAAAEQACALAEDEIRIGVHLGDVLVTPSGDLLGHGVNIAARLQQTATPGAVLVSVDVRRAVRGALANRLQAYGPVRLSKMAETIEAFLLGAADAPVLEMRGGPAQPVGFMAKKGAVRSVPATPPVAPQAPAPLLAVLAFDNESDHELDYFAEGIADEIMVILMRQSTLKVIGRTSSFQFRGKDKGAAPAALRASHVLDGVVRRAGARVRISTQLIEARTGVALWSARYDRDLADAFDLQDDIALEVAHALRYALSRNDKQADPIDPAAYDLYLRARQIWLTLSDLEEGQAETLLERCVARAPDFAPAWAALASARAFLLPRDRDMIGEPMHDRALAAARRALELDPDCPRAFGALALLLPGFGAYAEKIRLTEEALKRTPHDPALHVAQAGWLFGVGRIRDALAALYTAIELDPRWPVVESLHSALLSGQGDIEGALDVIAGAWSRWPDSAFTWYMMWLTLCMAGRLDEAEAMGAPENNPKRGVQPQDISVLREQVALLRLPQEERVAAFSAELGALSRSDAPLPVWTCMLAAANGCADQAFDLLHEALDTGRPIAPDRHSGFGMARGQTSLELFFNTGGVRFHAHKRFPRLAARLGLTEYWLSTGFWPDCADEVDYDFRAACAEAQAALDA